jgi:hypothetical protein
MTAARIYQMIYHPELTGFVGGSKSNYKFNSQNRLEGVTRNPNPKPPDRPKTQKESLQETLANLRAIPEKTRFHQNAIQMIEASLRNM